MSKRRCRCFARCIPRSKPPTTLPRTFSLLVSHQAELLDPWLATVENCGIAAFERLGRGIEQDDAAVVAGLTLPYSNGVVEGHVNR